MGGPKKTSIPSWLTPSKEQLSMIYSSMNRLQRARLDEAQEKGTESIYARYEAFSEENKDKHRVLSVAPYDAMRVRRLPDELYINASEIDGLDWELDRRQSWIAAQSPMKKTASEFLGMLFNWDDDKTPTTPRIIVSFKEDEQTTFAECFDYIPKGDDKEKTIVSEDTKIADRLGQFKVLLSTEKQEEYWTEREIEVINQNKTAKIYHFEYTGWLDRKIDSNTEDWLVRLWDAVKNRNMNNDESNDDISHSSPIIVHCPTGIGRTGVFITIASLIESIRGEDRERIAEHIIKSTLSQHQQNKNSFKKVNTQSRLEKGMSSIPADIPTNPVFFVIEYLRDNRLGMVQSLDQLETVFRALHKEYTRYVHPLYD